MDDRSFDDITLKFVFSSLKISTFHFSALLINTLLVHRRRQNMVEYSDALGCPLCASFSSNHILSLSPLICPEQAHGNMESAYCVNSIVASITKK